MWCYYNSNLKSETKTKKLKMLKFLNIFCTLHTVDTSITRESVTKRRPRRVGRKFHKYLYWYVKVAVSILSLAKYDLRFIQNLIFCHLGKGVFATKMFKKGSFLLEYKGELISQEGERREEEYDVSLGSFIFFFKMGRKTMWWVRLST